ncbi:MAG: hypothetical protein HOQ09_10765 [Gemmatimonadaceae bacterium]|nr:hypothetical protein [Gemmatimonadaceae bacterium]
MTRADTIRIALVASLLMPTALTLGAQGPSADSLSHYASDCRGFNGIYLHAWWGGSDSSRATGDSSGFRFDGRRTLDTTLTFDVAERRWTRSSVNAVVLAGASSGKQPARTGTTGAAATDSVGRDWHVCTGATVSGQQPTLLLRGVRGTLRLKVDLTPLTNIRGSGLTDSTRTPRR